MSEPVVALGRRDIRGLLSPGNVRRQSLDGFDDEYVDIVDYIVRVTYKIWEQRGIGRINDYYRPDVVIHTSDRSFRGRGDVISASAATMNAFPDVRLYPDDVIWSGDDEEGFHTSHRIVWVGRNDGPSPYGPATGRRIVRSGIAHCFVKQNEIIEEWIARDELALVRQLGFDEHELAREMARKEAAGGAKPQDAPAILPPEKEGDSEIEAFLRRNMDETWNQRLLNKMDEHHVDNYLCHTTANRTLYGLDDYKAHVVSLLAAFPDARVNVDHVCWLDNGRDGYSAAVRWTLRGTHEGPGVYGVPTGRRVGLLGITHYEVRGGLFVEEWMMFDEFALLKQIHAPDA